MIRYLKYESLLRVTDLEVARIVKKVELFIQCDYIEK